MIPWGHSYSHCHVPASSPLPHKKYFTLSKQHVSHFYMYQSFFSWPYSFLDNILPKKYSKALALLDLDAGGLYVVQQGLLPGESSIRLYSCFDRGCVRVAVAQGLLDAGQTLDTTAFFLSSSPLPSWPFFKEHFFLSVYLFQYLSVCVYVKAMHVLNCLPIFPAPDRAIYMLKMPVSFHS